MIRYAITTAMVATILARTPATAQSTTAITDGEVVRCIVATSMVGKKLTGVEEASVAGVAMYFLGKLAARHTPAEIKVLVDRGEAESAKLALVPLAQECAKEVQELGTTLQGK